MSSRTYDDQLITGYLLGSLTAEETEWLDELSLTDDDFAVRLQMVENDLVDAYVKDELSGQMRDRFDAHYLASPKRREKVAFAAELQSRLKRAPIIGQAESQGDASQIVPTESRPADPRGIGNLFRLPRPLWQWGLATAALLILALGGWLAIDNWRLRNRINQTLAEQSERQRREQQLQAELQAQRDAEAEREKELTRLREQLARIEPSNEPSPKQLPLSERPPDGNTIALALTPQTRGIAEMANLSLPAEAHFVKLELALEPTEFTHYRAELVGQANQVIWRSGKVRATNAGKSLVLTVRANLLNEQRYQVNVYGISPTGAATIISSYPFRVVK